ncbi:MAG: chorismate mutase [Acetobacteraceae bacterium]
MPPMDPKPGDPNPADLTALRAEIDRIDDALHDLLMRRAEMVEQVAGSAAKAATSVALRPGREAAIIRRLLARHEGRLPAQALVRLWRELLAATTSMQRPFAIAVGGADLAGVAREQFGNLTPLRVHASPAQAIATVSGGNASAAVLPLPTQDEPAGTAWWTSLLRQDRPRLHVVGRLPFWAPRAEGAPTAEALVVAAVTPDASGEDRGLIAVEMDSGVSHARLSAALIAADLAPRSLILRRDPGQGALGLVEVDGALADDDPRLARIGALRPPVVLGIYAIPVAGAGS